MPHNATEKKMAGAAVNADDALKYMQVFMPLSKSEMAALLQYCEWRHFDKKKIIVKQGDTDNYLNIVVKGLVRKYVIVRRTEQTLQLATEGHIIQSEISFLTRSPSIVNIETLEPTTMLSLRHDKMEEALQKLPNGERLGRMILTFMYIRKDERRFARTSKSIRELFADYITRHPHMLQRVPQKYLASYLNIKPETFSRLKRLAMTTDKKNKKLDINQV
jgi:CRP-like cAMP-binding protein